MMSIYAVRTSKSRCMESYATAEAEAGMPAEARKLTLI